MVIRHSDRKVLLKSYLSPSDFSNDSQIILREYNKFDYSTEKIYIKCVMSPPFSFNIIPLSFPESGWLILCRVAKMTGSESVQVEKTLVANMYR